MAEKLNQVDEALQFADRAEELSPHSGMVKDTVGWVLYRKGLISAAVERLKTGGGFGVHSDTANYTSRWATIALGNKIRAEQSSETH